MAELTTYDAWINGDWYQPVGGEYFDSVNLPVEKFGHASHAVTKEMLIMLSKPRNMLLMLVNGLA